jgi:hypothetical protein
MAQIKIHKIPDLGSSFYIIIKTGVLTFIHSGFENTGTHKTTKMHVYYVYVTNTTLYNLRSTAVFMLMEDGNALPK